MAVAISRMSRKKKLLLELYRPKPSSLIVGKEINRGAYGAVLGGTFEGRRVAIKKMHKFILDTADTDEEIERLVRDFKRETDTLLSIRHPHVVQAFGAFYDPLSWEPILVMELMANNLREYLEKNKGNLKLSKQIHICLQIALGLQFLHHLNPPLAHRDLTDKNVLLADDGTVKIGDLGQSKYKDLDVYFRTEVPGALYYMAPETVKPSGSHKAHYTESVDIFSLGVLTMEIATQSSPTPSLHGLGILPEVKRRERDLNKMDNSHPLKPLVYKCLENNYKKRPVIANIVDDLACLIVEEYNNMESPHTDVDAQVAQKEAQLLQRDQLIIELGGQVSILTEQNMELEQARRELLKEISEKRKIGPGETETEHFKEDSHQVKSLENKILHLEGQVAIVTEKNSELEREKQELLKSISDLKLEVPHFSSMDVVTKVLDSEKVLDQLCWFPFGLQRIEVGPSGGIFILDTSTPTMPTVESKHCSDNSVYIEVPPNAVEPDETLSIHYGVTPDGPFIFPKGYKLCSVAVYIFTLGASLKESLTLHIPHWCSEDSTQTNAREDALVKSCWSPHTLKRDQQMFEFSVVEDYIPMNGANDIQICGKKCLFANVISEDVEESYQCHVFEDEVINLTRQLVILVTFESPIWRRIVKKYYKPLQRCDKNWKLKDYPVSFTMPDSDTLRLSFDPPRGTKWSMKSEGLQELKKTSVDYRMCLSNTKDCDKAGKLKARVESCTYPPSLWCEVYQNYPPYQQCVDISLKGVSPPVTFHAQVMEWGTTTASSQNDPMKSPTYSQTQHEDSVSPYPGVPSPTEKYANLTEFFEDYKEKLLIVVPAKAISSKLGDRHVIPKATVSAMESLDDCDKANSKLYDHLSKHADYELAVSLCKVMTEDRAYPKMQKLGNTMLEALHSNAETLAD